MARVIFDNDWLDPNSNLVRKSDPVNASGAREVSDDPRYLAQLPSTAILLGDNNLPVDAAKSIPGPVRNPLLEQDSESPAIAGQPDRIQAASQIALEAKLAREAAPKDADAEAMAALIASRNGKGSRDPKPATKKKGE